MHWTELAAIADSDDQQNQMQRLSIPACTTHPPLESFLPSARQSSHSFTHSQPSV
ncbi:hypothetical protein SynA15127_02035 [Synechococcus sp. A15-127]|nr:hypothetical protein SynA15127_02035 [Synechococcus sp. A15-127]